MSLSIKQRKEDEVTVLELSGRLTIGQPVLSLWDAVRSAVDDGDLKFVVNLGDVNYIDNSGLGELVSIYTTVRNKKGDVKLLKLTAKTKDLLQMTKLLTVFDTYDGEADTLAALKGWRGPDNLGGSAWESNPPDAGSPTSRWL
jgi:anti-sigma B factor antagonist